VAIVTSRNQLAGLIAEGACPLTVDLLAAADARGLLARRLGAARIAAEPDAVDEIIAGCARLPLALAIAAARAATRPGFPLAVAAAELHETSRTLDAFDGDDPATNVRAVFSWSYRALSDDAARLFRLLGLHPGPDISIFAAASLAGIAEGQARQLLAELTRAHLLAEHVPGRFTLHDLLRSYADELAHGQDSEPLRAQAVRRLLDHYLHTARCGAELLEPYLDPFSVLPAAAGVIAEPPGTTERALSWFADEHANLLAAVQLAGDSDLSSHAWQLAWTLSSYLIRRSLWHDTALACNAALDVARRSADVAGQARCMHRLASACAMSLRLAEATGLFEQVLELYATVGDCAGQAAVHRTLMWIAGREDRHADALQHSLQAQELLRAAGNQAGQVRVLTDIAYGHAALGSYEEALGYCERALAEIRELGEPSWEDTVWDTLGYIHRHLGNYQQAITCYRRAFELCEEAGDPFNEASMLDVLGDTHREAGADDEARRAWARALRILDEIGHPDADEIREKLGPGRDWLASGA
jgi:tetratricopeptide (TPR) repeat protein